MLLVVGGSAAKTRTEKPALKLLLEEKDKDKDIQSGRLDLVRSLIARRSFISAANLLEEMYAENPENREVVNLLLNCYNELKAYSRAELLLARQLEAYPQELQYHDRLLDVYLRDGIDSTISRQIEIIFEKFPGNPAIYRAVIEKLIRYGYNEKALNLIERGRQKFGSSSLFAFESAQLFETKASYYDAVWEYFRAVSGDSLMKQPADRRMASLIRFPGAVEEVIEALEDILDSLPDDNYTLKVLQEAYIKAERFEDAFGISIKTDSLTESRGQELFRYLTRCRDQGLYDQVIKMAEYIEQASFKKDLISAYRLYFAEALVKSGRYSDAISIYHHIVDNYPDKRDQGTALLEIGNTYRYGLKNYDSARVYYRTVAYSYMLGWINTSAWLEMGGLYLVEGKLDSAQSIYKKFEGKRVAPQLTELVAYNLAMIQLFEGKYENADLAFRKLIEDNPRGFYVNDALINSLIIRESLLMYPAALSEYVEALYFKARETPDSMESRFLSIIEMGETPLIGLAMYKLATFYAESNDTARALATIAGMEKEYSDNYFYPFSLKLKGDILFDDEDKRGLAAEIYTRLLQEYSNYPFIGEIREVLQKIEIAEPAS